VKILEFCLSDLNSFSKELEKKHGFTETSYNHYNDSKCNKNNSFFKRVAIESGLEIWILTAQFDEDIILRQKQSVSSNNAIHIYDFDGAFVSDVITKIGFPSSGIYITDGSSELIFKIKAHEKINIVSIVCSNRWLEVSLFNLPHFKDLFDANNLLKKYNLHESIKAVISKIISMTLIGVKSNFMLRMNIFSLLKNVFEFIEDEMLNKKGIQLPIQKSNQKVILKPNHSNHSTLKAI
jgi:hypothetical protein